MPKILSRIKQPNGFILITTILIMAMLLLLAVYVTSFTLTEYKIANSQSASAKTYYLAESGVAEAIWKIKNDAEWKTQFETNPSWSATFTRNPALYPNSSYQIQIQNTGLARGEVTVTSYLTSGNSTAQRVVKTVLFKALGESAIGDNGEVADGNVTVSGSVMNIHGSSMMANGNIIINTWSTVNADKDVKATGQINVHWTSALNAQHYYSANFPPAPAPLPMPGISFDNPGDPNSYKARANQIYTKNQFENLLWANPNLTLNGITYVTGDVEIKGGHNLTINGTLVADGDITVGKNLFWPLCCWSYHCGFSDVTITQPSATSSAGLLSKRKINFEACLGNFNAHGLIYANDQAYILSAPNDFEVIGAVVSRKFDITSIWQGLDITLENGVVVSTLGDATFSPVVTVEHWEEEY